MTAPNAGLVVITTDELKAIVREQLDQALAEHAPKTTEEPLLLTCSKLCKKLGLSRATVYRLRRQGLPCVPVGDEHRYVLAEVVAWLRSKSTEGETSRHGGRAQEECRA